MLKKFPPYRIIAFAGSLLLVAFVVWAYRLRAGTVPGWTFSAAIVVAALVTGATLLGLGQLVGAYRKGYLFPLRNATLFLTGLSALAIPLLVVYELVQPGSMSASTLLLLPVFLFLISRNLFSIKIDEVVLEAKLGLRPATYVPLYNITRVEEDERGIVVSRSDGDDLRLLRVFFFTGDWIRLRDRLADLGVANP